MMWMAVTVAPAWIPPSSLLVRSASSTSLDVAATSKTLGLITFDLDDTLFDCGKTVQSANDAMLQALRELGAADATLPDFLKQT
eukprot:3480740-Amphidinium_carterae.1